MDAGGGSEKDVRADFQAGRNLQDPLRGAWGASVDVGTSQRFGLENL